MTMKRPITLRALALTALLLPALPASAADQPLAPHQQQARDLLARMVGFRTAAGHGQVPAMVDVIVAKYAPLPMATLHDLVNRLRLAAPQWAADRSRALAHAKKRLPHARVDGTDWYWPAGEDPAASTEAPERAWLLAPFDPLVWDRRRFEAFWGWAYRFEAYTPAPKRKLGYYALPLLWNEQVVGWGNLQVREGRLVADLGFVAGRPRSRAFTQALDLELQRMGEFLGL